MILRIFTAVILLTMTVSCNTKEQILTSESEFVHIYGRCDDSDLDNVRFSFPGVSVKIMAEADGASICLTDSSRLDDNGNVQHDMIGVIIDGQFTKKIELKEGRHTYLLADDLADGLQSIEVIKLTESMVGTVTFHHFQLDGATQFNQPAVAKRKIEFIGNSITCGYGIETDDENLHFDYRTENVCHAFAMQCAALVDAQAQLVCYSGKGVYRNWADTVFYQETMVELYTRILAFEPESEWDFARFTPNVVVINLGSNDFSPPLGAEKELFIPRYNQLLDLVRDNYGPYVPIVCLNGPLLIGEQRLAKEAWLQEIIASRKDKQIHYLPLTVCQPEDGWGADYHPSKASATRNAKELAQFLEQLMEWGQ